MTYQLSEEMEGGGFRHPDPLDQVTEAQILSNAENYKVPLPTRSKDHARFVDWLFTLKAMLEVEAESRYLLRDRVDTLLTAYLAYHSKESE